MKMKHLITNTGLVLSLGLGLLLTLVWPLSYLREERVAHAASFTVCPAGPPICDYNSIQAAVDAAGEGDVIKVAAGS